MPMTPTDTSHHEPRVALPFIGTSFRQAGQRHAGALPDAVETTKSGDHHGTHDVGGAG